MSRLQMKKNAIAAITLLFAIITNGQSHIRLMSTENSTLIDDELTSIAVDSNGIKWIGTGTQGIVKYDGFGFDDYNRGTPIHGNQVGPLFVDSVGNIWFATSSPNKLFRIVSGSIEEVESEIVTGLGRVISIAQNNNGILYFGGIKGLIKYDGKMWSRVSLPIENVIVRAIDIGSDNTIAIGHNNGLLIHSSKGWEIVREKENELQLSVVCALKFTPDNKLIVGYGGGVGKGGFSIKDGENWQHFNKENSKIPDNMVRDIEVDSNKNYWMATNNGLVKFSLNGYLQPLFFRDGPFQNTIIDVAIENKTIWVATNFGVVEIRN